ncbi:Retrovirus-related Pol polyprotein from transposon TNT 1-94 [Gossypium australe]|uniref:Retrovirus-related Pol polyprotein from transposon TNT 1-94 n=1 Tax=Gossypium australe TaxID=47621 RepID=A0A5B6VXD2_9ROSI|nr:Retrovirus-related Pol polyprotein from transposon TNT 1-94 [Gossypium australe]
MKTYMQAFDLWKVVNADVEPPPLRANPTVAQIRQHFDDRAKRKKEELTDRRSIKKVHFKPRADQPRAPLAIKGKNWPNKPRIYGARRRHPPCLYCKKVLEIDRNLLSIAQLLEKGYSVVFKGKKCLISDPSGSKLMSVTMTDRSFVADWNKNSVSAYTTALDESKLFCWGYFLKCKSKVVSVFWKFKAIEETQSSCKLKTLRSDNGTEYTSVMFQTFCEESGIEHQLTNTYTPQQNGVSERKNRTLMDMARCLMFERNLPKSFWAEAVNTVVYLQNRLPTKALLEKTPFEAWFGLPSVAHLKVFMGYSSVKKGNRILDPITYKVFVSRYVMFDERLRWNWDKSELKCTAEYLVTKQTKVDHNDPEMDIHHEPVRGTRPLSEIYERACVATVEPTCFEEAQAQEGWRQAMLYEISMIHKNQTWELVARPVHRKARLVVKGFSQKYGIGYLETFAPVARLDTIRLLVVLAAQRLGFERSNSEPTLYVKKEGDETLLIVSLHVDDLLVTRGNNAMLIDFKGNMESMFEMSNLGEMSYFLGMEVSQIQQGIFLSQKGFALKILNKFSIQNYKATSTPIAVGEKLSSQDNFEKVSESTYRSLVGCLLYLTATRVDIMFAVSLLSRFMHCCNMNNFQAAKRVLRYIKRTLCFGVMFTKVDIMKFLGFADSDWAGSIDDMKSTSGKIMADLNLHQREATEIRSDNKSAVTIAKNPVFHGKTKHFKIKFHFVREMEQSQEIKLVHCSSKDQLADILTKALGVTRCKNLRARLGVCSMEAREEC